MRDRNWEMETESAIIIRKRGGLFGEANSLSE